MRNDDIAHQLRSVETTIHEYKNRQKIAGDSQKIYRTLSENEWDIRLTGLNTNSQYLKRWKVTYQIDGGLKIPNAFAIFMSKVDTGQKLDYGTGTLTTGFGYNEEDDGEDPLALYFMIYAEYNWVNTTASFINVRFRAISPYKGKIIYEELQ